MLLLASELDSVDNSWVAEDRDYENCHHVVAENIDNDVVVVVVDGNVVVVAVAAVVDDDNVVVVAVVAVSC